MKRFPLLPLAIVMSCCWVTRCGAQAERNGTEPTGRTGNLPALPNPAPPPDANGARPAVTAQNSTAQAGQPVGNDSAAAVAENNGNVNTAPRTSNQTTGADTQAPANTADNVATDATPDEGSFKTGENRAVTVTSSTTTATTSTTPAPPSTPAPVPSPTIQPTPVPTRAVQEPQKTATPTVKAVPVPALPSNSYLPMSPLWKVGTVLLTLLGLALIVAFAPEFGPSPSGHTTVAAMGGGFTSLGLIMDTFSGASPAASLAQCLLTLAGFGGLVVSGFLDGHRNRIGAGLMWLAASALLTHSLSHGSPTAGTISGGLAVIGGMLSFAYCVAVFLPGQNAPVADKPANADAAQTVATAAARPPATARPQGRGAASKGAEAKTDVARLIAVEGTLKGQVFPLRNGANAVGRDAGALDGNKVLLNGDELVSRIHALVMCDNTRCVLSDTGAASGIFLNGGRVLDDRDLMNGDRLQIGGTTFLYQRI